MHTNPKSNKN